jgi:DnaJ-class molecular chaperone
MNPLPKNFYDFFGLEHRLDLDAKDLEKRFYALSRKYHPDGYTLKRRESSSMR